jgi:hypothetical protein
MNCGDPIPMKLLEPVGRLVELLVSTLAQFAAIVACFVAAMAVEVGIEWVAGWLGLQVGEQTTFGSMLLWLRLTVFTLVPAWALIVYSEWRFQRRFERILCPCCGQQFGTGSLSGFWSVRCEGGGSSGPLMTCKSCGRQFRYSNSGSVDVKYDEWARSRTGLAGH